MISLHPQVLELTGVDAAAFAHAQFGNDVLALPDEHWQWNAWLSPQGRVRAFFHLLRTDAANLSLILRGGEAEWLRAELSRYVFRAKVQLRVARDSRLCGSADAATVMALTGALPESSAIVRDAGVSVLTVPGNPQRWLALGSMDAATDAAALERWRLADIRAGIPWIDSELRDRLLPQWIALDRLGAISVRKGCYPGQEIVARLHFKGGNKRSLYRLRWCGDAVPRAGTYLRDDHAAEAGIVLTAARNGGDGHVEALATLSDAAADVPLQLESSAAGSVGVVQHFA